MRTYLRAAQTNALKCESAERFKGVWVVIMISMTLRSDWKKQKQRCNFQKYCSIYEAVKKGDIWRKQILYKVGLTRIT